MAFMMCFYSFHATKIIEGIIALFVLKASSAQGSVAVCAGEDSLYREYTLYQTNERRARRGIVPQEDSFPQQDPTDD
jgi:hypothetical protein